MFIDADGNKCYLDETREATQYNIVKEKTYTSRTGLDFWFDVNSHTVWTSQDSIFLHEFWSNDRDNPGAAFILHIAGRSIGFSNTGSVFPDVPYMDDIAQKRSDGSRFWEIGIIGGQYRNLERIAGEKSSKAYDYSNSDHFESKEQQEFALTLLEDILSNFTGSFLGQAHGKEQSADVLFTDELKEKIERGDFIEGAGQ